MTAAGVNAVGSPPIVMTRGQWEIVVEILRCHAGGRTVWAYGSRARGDRVKKYSDLDLIVGGEPFRRLEEWKLEEAFDESLLPFRVEFRHESELSEEFRRGIEADFVEVQASGTARVSDGEETASTCVRLE